MMDRIEDETVRYLYFLQVNTNTGPILPYPDEDEQNGDGAGNGEPSGQGGGDGRAAAAEAVEEERRRAAKAQMEDFTRNIERKKDKELAALQLGGGDDSGGPKTVAVGQKVGRNDPCPCGSGKKYKKCHGHGSSRRLYERGGASGGVPSKTAGDSAPCPGAQRELLTSLFESTYGRNRSAGD